VTTPAKEIVLTVVPSIGPDGRKAMASAGSCSTRRSMDPRYWFWRCRALEIEWVANHFRYPRRSWYVADRHHQCARADGERPIRERSAAPISPTC
jgi:hypothetical protein